MYFIMPNNEMPRYIKELCKDVSDYEKAVDTLNQEIVKSLKNGDFFGANQLMDGLKSIAEGIKLWDIKQEIYEWEHDL